MVVKDYDGIMRVCGTNVTVERVKRAWRDGADYQTIREDFGISIDQIKAALKTL
jgi:uncharacterized protein (DUF433 family)